MVDLYRVSVLRANLLLKQNIDGLLHDRGYTRKDLAQWCHRTEGWISKIFRKGEREIPLKYLDRIADFFGLQAWQLFQPGITRASERRKRLDRRQRAERRVANRMEMLNLQETRQVGEKLTGRSMPLEIDSDSTAIHGEGATSVPSSGEYLASIQATLNDISIELAALAAGGLPDRSIASTRPKTSRRHALAPKLD